MLRPSLHSTLVAVAIAVTLASPAPSNNPVAVDSPFAQDGLHPTIAPSILDVPFTARYRVYRHHPPRQSSATLVAGNALPQIWTTDGSRVIADSGEWTFESTRDGRWISEFTVGDSVAQPTSRRGPARRYALIYDEDVVFIREVFPNGGETSHLMVEPPPEIISDYARTTFPLSTLAIEHTGSGNRPMTIREALETLPISRDEIAYGGRTRTMELHGGLAQLVVTTDSRGIISRIEELAGDLGAGPLLREVTDITESRLVEGHQIPWRFTRTIFDGDRVWERIEFEMVEVLVE